MTNNRKKSTGNKSVIPSKDMKPSESLNGQKAENPIARIVTRILFLSALLLSGIILSDKKGLFNSNQANDHTLRKWNSYYEFTKRNNVDVLLIGNSHLYTGINPKNLSTTLGANSFILAAPGTHMADFYFSLKEALKRSKPGLVIIETYGIKEFNPYELSMGGLSDQLKSFSARKDLVTKMVSTPFLFSSENYIHAWSNTIRNHEYIFSNPTQLKQNRELAKQKKRDNEGLYLGRYVRFTTGIEDSIMNKYITEGPRVDGKDYTYNQYTEKYVDKIVRLCEKNGINCMFLTLPMYAKHIKDYQVWKEKLGEILYGYDVPWLDMQDSDLNEAFTPICFENTYNTNQHMTYQGSLIATYMLANYIKQNEEIKLADRRGEQQWHNLFYGDEGYIENFSPHPNDKRYKVISKDQDFNNITLKEVYTQNVNNGNSTILTAKLNRNMIDHIDLSRSTLQLIITYSENGVIKNFTVPMIYDALHAPQEIAIFSQSFRSQGIELIAVADAIIQ